LRETLPADQFIDHFCILRVRAVSTPAHKSLCRAIKPRATKRSIGRKGVSLRVTFSQLGELWIGASACLSFGWDAPKTRIRKSIQADLARPALMQKYALAPSGKSVVPLRASCA
jgi:hypothetical protein